MQLLHENPVIPREAIRIALQPPPDQAGTLPPWLRALRDSGLQDQIEQLRITPEYLSTEDMSKFWTATLAHYRPCAAYEVSVVLIQAEEPKPNPLPVLERRLRAQPNLAPTVPTISAVVPAGKQPVVGLGSVVTLEGFALSGATREAVLTNDRFAIEQPLSATGGNATRLEFTIPPARAADFPAGFYKVAARIQLPTETAPRLSNQLGLTIAPHVDNLPQTIASGGGTANITLNFTPEVRAGQTVRLVLGVAEYAPQSFTAPTGTLDFQVPNAPLGEHLVRLCIDGVDSPIVDPAATPPVFLDRRITIQ
jgi:hypothetical protein